jgi:dienelactone hydrolase
VVLVLHGGAARRDGATVSSAQLSVLRMIPIARHIARVGRGQLAVFRLLNSCRGWDTSHTPVQDARWALDQIDGRLGARGATCLVGHSLGGRAALLTADRPGVASVVALAPWVYPDDRAEVCGRQVLIVHGSDDRVAKPKNSAALARNLAGATADSATADSATVGYVLVNGARHAMLRHHRRFTGLAADFAVATLLGRKVQGPVAQILAGQRWIEI